VPGSWPERAIRAEGVTICPQVMLLCRLVPSWSYSGRVAVPEPQHRGLALVPEPAQRRRIEREQPPVPSVQPEPARRQHPQNMPVREEQYVPVDRAHLFKQTIDPSPYLLGGLAVRRVVAEDRPARSLL